MTPVTANVWTVGVGVAVDVGVDVGVLVDVGVGVLVGVGFLVGVGESEGVGSSVGVGSIVGDISGVGVGESCSVFWLLKPNQNEVPVIRRATAKIAPRTIALFLVIGPDINF